MDNLTPGERAFADLAAAGFDEQTLAAEMRSAPKHEPDGTIIIAAFEEGVAVELRVTALMRVPNLRSAFGLGLAIKALSVSRLSFRSHEGCLVPFVDFLVDKKLAAIKPRDITNALLDDFRDWLNDHEKASSAHARPNTTIVFPTDGGGQLKVATKIARMSVVISTLAMLRVDSQWWPEIRPDLDLIRASDWSAAATDRKPVEILTRPQLKMLVRICRDEVSEITERLRSAWAVMDGQEPSNPMSGADREMILEVTALHTRFDGKPPKQQALSRALGTDKLSFPRLRRLKAPAYNAALATIYPTGRMLMPFLILFAIYYRYNRSVVTTLKASHFSEQPSAHGIRLRGMPFKNRAGRTQYASWPVTDEAHNPAEMIKTLERWTALIRERADPDDVNHIFLERIMGSKIRSLGDLYGFALNFARFLTDHEATIGKRFVFKALRPSVINLVYHLFDGDPLATAEAGQHSVRTLMDHYLFDGARKMNEEALIPAMHLRNAWVLTNGKVDGREDKRRGDISAATPGFGCQDRYASKMSGQRPDRLCTAYGMCPACPLKKVDKSSPEAYALIVKLREAIIRSRPKMPAATWLARWSAVQDVLELKILRQFPRKVRERADLDIPQLPTVE